MSTTTSLAAVQGITEGAPRATSSGGAVESAQQGASFATVDQLNAREYAPTGTKYTEGGMGSEHETGKEKSICRVLLIDPDELVRCAFKKLIESIDRFQVVAEGATHEDALQRLEQGGIDLLITEVALPKTSGVELLHEVTRRRFGVRSILVSHLDSADIVTQALLAGAQGYILKSGSFEDFKNGLETAFLSNKKYLPPSIAHLIDVPENGYELGAKGNATDPLSALSPREREIFHLLANGLQNTVIAKKLFISPRTVETHRARVVRKLGLQTNGELIRFAIKRGLTVP